MTQPTLSKSDLLRPKIMRLETGCGSVLIRALSAAYAISLRGKSLADDQIFDMLARSICDEDGAPIMTPAEVGEIDLKTLQAIVNGVLEFNSLAEGSHAAAADALKKTSAESASSISSP
jgi:hypothetical protein